MSLKSVKHEDSKQENIGYPCLKVCRDGRHNEGMVVLFYERGEGTIVYGSNGHYRGREGFHMTGWGMSYFDNFEGKLELNNE